MLASAKAEVKNGRVSVKLAKPDGKEFVPELGRYKLRVTAEGYDSGYYRILQDYYGYTTEYLVNKDDIDEDEGVRYINGKFETELERK